jgi:adhesin transport system membrane fusion protein
MNRFFAIGSAAPHHDPDHGPKRTVAAMVAVILVFLLVAVVWAALAELDVSVQARGIVVPPSRLQEVQSLEGGILQELLVVPGQAVRRGQVLALLDGAQFRADLGESRHQLLGALAGRARVEALLSGAEPRFDAAWRKEAPDLIAKETQLWRDAQREYQASGQAAAEAVLRKRGELAEAHARIHSLQTSNKLAEESLSIEERLFKEGAGARADYLAAQQRLLSQKLELEAAQQALPRLAAGLAEAQALAAEAGSKARAQWGTQRAEYETRVATITSTVGGKADRVERRSLVSPTDGVVNRVLVTTLGGVVPPGRSVVEVVPNESNLLMNARVKPSDIGFIHAGQVASVRVQAYDASTYGKMDATVLRVGADAVQDERSEPYFEVQLEAAPGQLMLHGKPLAVTPGMTVDVGILTGRRTVMQYLLKPVLRGLQGALQER